MTPDEPLVIAYPHETMNGVRIDAAVLPTADAPTAEDLRDALDYATPFVSGQVTRTSSRVPTDPITARRTAVLRWLVSHLPAMLAARADNERLTRELADANERAIDYMNAALRASRSPEGGPNG